MTAEINEAISTAIFADICSDAALNVKMDVVNLMLPSEKGMVSS